MEENRTASYGEHAFIQSLSDKDLLEFIVDLLEMDARTMTELEMDYLNIAEFEAEERGLNRP